MRALIGIVVLLSGCIISKDECNKSAKKATDDITQAAPGAVLAVALSGCSTCDHSSVQGKWPYQMNATGYIEIQLSPHCFVQDTTIMANPTADTGVADNNWKNCGDVIDLDGYVTNRTNVTLPYMSIELTCPSMGE